MNRLAASLALAAAIALAGCAALERIAAPPTDAGDPELQLLVMIEAATPHYQPGVAGASGYAVHGARVRAESIAAAIARDHGVKLVRGWPMPALALHCFVMEVAPGASTASVAERIAADLRVESAQPVQLFRTLSRTAVDAGHRSSERRLELAQLHRTATGRDVRIAQADTGADLGHPGLAGRLATARNFVDGSAYAAEVHGTAVAGIIVARPINGVGTAGVAPDATLLPLRACWEDPANADAALCTSFTLAKAIQFALERQVRVLNLSLSGPRDRLLERLIDRAAERGVAVIGAVDSAAPDRGFPASHPRVIAVALGDDPRLPEHAILAPGREILTTVPAGGWGWFSGASFAAAHVAGIAALMIETRPSLSGEEIRAVLQSHGQRPSPAGGAPRLDACAALAEAAKTRSCAP